MAPPKLGMMETMLYHSISWAWAGVFVYALPTLLKPQWDDLVKQFGGDEVVFIWGTWAMNMGLTIAYNLSIIPIYALRIPFFERFKISPKPWPWHSSVQEERDAFWSFLPRSIALVVFNNLTIALPGAWGMWELRRLTGGCSMAASDIPDLPKLLLHLALCCVVEDTMFYWSHRTLHRPEVYPWVHKWHHAYNQPIALASEHAHPIEFAMGNLLPVMGGPVLLQVAHTLTGNPLFKTLWMHILLRIYVSVDEHCGYEFPWSPVRLLQHVGIRLGATAGGHDWHHSHNAGMYASQFAWWDALCGTDKVYKSWLAKQEALQAAPASASASPVPATSPRATARAGSTNVKGKQVEQEVKEAAAAGSPRREGARRRQTESKVQ